MNQEQKAAIVRLAEESSGRFVAAETGVPTEAMLRDESDRLRTALAAAEKQCERLKSALQPFADIGSWLFARPQVPDTDVVVDVLGVNRAQGSLTRGQFKAAHTALTTREGT